MHGSIQDRGDDSSGSAAGDEASRRRPYVAPAIEETADFETLALACAGTPVACDPEDQVEPQEPSS